jgi:hypothetical protein
MPSSTKFALFCLELAEYDLSCPLLTLMDRYNQRLTTQPHHTSFPSSTLPPFRDFVYMIRTAPQKELTDISLLRKKLGDVILNILDHRYAWLRDGDLHWVDGGMLDTTQNRLREILQSEEAQNTAYLRQAVEALDKHMEHKNEDHR